MSKEGVRIPPLQENPGTRSIADISHLTRMDLINRFHSQGKAAEVLREVALPLVETYLLMDFGELLEPAFPTLPNLNAVSIGCDTFPEAIPWVHLTDGIIHGIDPNKKSEYMESYLHSAIMQQMITDDQSRRVGYAFSRPFANAVNLDPYLIDHYGLFGIAFIRHPIIIARAGTFEGDGKQDSIYPYIIDTLLGNVLFKGGIGYVTFYDKEEADIFYAALKSYVNEQVIQMGLQGENGGELISSNGVERKSEIGDNVILALRKLRDIPDEERGALLIQSREFLKEELERYFIRKG